MQPGMPLVHIGDPEERLLSGRWATRPILNKRWLRAARVVELD